MGTSEISHCVSTPCSHLFRVSIFLSHDMKYNHCQALKATGPSTNHRRKPWVKITLSTFLVDPYQVFVMVMESWLTLVFHLPSFSRAQTLMSFLSTVHSLSPGCDKLGPADGVMYKGSCVLPTSPYHKIASSTIQWALLLGTGGPRKIWCNQCKLLGLPGSHHFENGPILSSPWYQGQAWLCLISFHRGSQF